MDTSCTDVWKLLHAMLCLARSDLHAAWSVKFPVGFPLEEISKTIWQQAVPFVFIARHALKSERVGILREALAPIPPLVEAVTMVTIGDIEWTYNRRRHAYCIGGEIQSVRRHVEAQLEDHHRLTVPVTNASHVMAVMEVASHQLFNMQSWLQKAASKLRCPSNCRYMTLRLGC